MLPRVSVPNTESRTTCFVLHHTHIFGVIFQASKLNPATYILHKIFAISLVTACQEHQTDCLLWISPTFFPRLLWRIWYKNVAPFLCLFHTLCSESSGRFCFLGNAQFRYPQVLSVPLMSSLVLFFVLFFSLPTSLRVRLSWCLVVLMTPSLVLQQGASQKRGTKSRHWSVCADFLCTSPLMPLSLLMPTEVKGVQRTYMMFLTEKMANSVNY